MTDDAVRAAREAMRGTAERRGVSEDTMQLLASDAVEAAKQVWLGECCESWRPVLENERAERDAARTDRDRYRAALEDIASRRCLSEGPCATHGHPQCVAGSCVTCRARAALDGEETP